jgi:Protein of unknown function (DUF2946)
VKRTLAKALAFTLALFVVVLLVQVGSHAHGKGRSDAACQICHAAHLGAGLTDAASTLVAPLLVTGQVPPLALAFILQLFSYDSPSRAPPAA